MINQIENVNNLELILIQRNFNRMTSLINYFNTEGEEGLIKYEYNFYQLKSWVNALKHNNSKLSDIENELLNKFDTQVNKLEAELIKFKENKLNDEQAQSIEENENSVEELEEDSEEEEEEEEEEIEEEEIERARKPSNPKISSSSSPNLNILEDGIRQRSNPTNNKSQSSTSQNYDEDEDDDDDDDDNKEDEKDPDLTRKLQQQETIQSQLTSNLINMTQQLKSNTLSFGDILKKDEQVLESASHHLETNLTQLKTDSTRLQKLNKESASHFWRTFGVVIATVLLFIWTVIFIRIFPKLPEYR